MGQLFQSKSITDAIFTSCFKYSLRNISLLRTVLLIFYIINCFWLCLISFENSIYILYNLIKVGSIWDKIIRRSCRNALFWMILEQSWGEYAFHNRNRHSEKNWIFIVNWSGILKALGLYVSIALIQDVLLRFLKQVG